MDWKFILIDKYGRSLLPIDSDLGSSASHIVDFSSIWTETIVKAGSIAAKLAKTASLKF